MRVSVDLDLKTLKEIFLITGEKKKSPAIAKALQELLRLRRLQDFSDRILTGHYNYPLTNKQIEKQDQ